MCSDRLAARKFQLTNMELNMDSWYYRPNWISGIEVRVGVILISPITCRVQTQIGNAACAHAAGRGRGTHS